MLSIEEMAERQYMVTHAIASQRLEGLEIDAQTLADFERYVKGELELADILPRIRSRLHGKI